MTQRQETIIAIALWAVLLAVPIIHFPGIVITAAWIGAGIFETSRAPHLGPWSDFMFIVTWPFYVGKEL